jgi:hypothetical protein
MERPPSTEERRRLLRVPPGRRPHRSSPAGKIAVGKLRFGGEIGDIWAITNQQVTGQQSFLWPISRAVVAKPSCRQAAKRRAVDDRALRVATGQAKERIDQMRGRTGNGW